MSKDKNTAANASASTAVLAAKDVAFTPVSLDAQASYAVWIRALMQNWRQGTVGCKDRSEVARTNKKPWKQKGTGRARAGTARSPLWRGGGVIFGPQARVKTLKISKKSKKAVFAALMSQWFEQGKVFVLDWQMSTETPSTKAFVQALQSAGLQDKRVSLFLQRDDVIHWMSLRNVSSVNPLSFDDVNAYDLSLGDCLVVLKKDVDLFKEMVAQWN